MSNQDVMCQKVKYAYWFFFVVGVWTVKRLMKCSRRLLYFSKYLLLPERFVALPPMDFITLQVAPHEALFIFYDFKFVRYLFASLFY